MLSSPLLPLPPEFPLRQLLSLVQGHSQTGAWVRESGKHHRLTITADGRCGVVEIGQDLGQLLRCCQQVVVQAGPSPAVVPAEALIRWRALQVLTSAPCLTQPEQLREIFPQAAADPAGFYVPLEDLSPEEVLARCVRHGIPVTESRMVYRRSMPASS